MKTGKKHNRSRIATINSNFRQNIRMARFIREIERESPLDNDILRTMEEFRFQLV